ncbi:hypothetical protein OROMI_020728 [Orobanche minor]
MRLRNRAPSLVSSAGPSSAVVSSPHGPSSALVSSPHGQEDFFPSFRISQEYMGMIMCHSKEDALAKHKILSSMPKRHFIRSLCACMVDEVPLIALQQHQNIFYEKGRRTALRDINTPMELEINGMPHGNLTEIVAIDLLPKFRSIPALIDNYDSFRINIRK